MRHLRHYYVIGSMLILALIVGGCAEEAGGGAGAGETTPPAVAEATATPTPSPTVEATATPTPAPTPTAPAATPEPTAAEPAGESAPVLPATVTDKDGNEVTITDVSRIIPLNGDIAEIVWALGLGDNVVATDASATYPEEARALPKIGYQRRLSAEGILALNPTVIIGDDSAGPPEVIEQLRTAGVPIVIIEDPATLDTPPAKIRQVAAALGVPERGEALAAQVEAEIQAALDLAGQATSRPTVVFLYLRGTDTQMIGGRGTTADVMIEAAGGIDAGSEAGIENYKPLTAESMVAAAPDVLLVLSAGLESVGGEEGLLQLPGIAQTPAGENRRILVFDDLYLLGMGPRTGQALHDLVLGLHPELRG